MKIAYDKYYRTENLFGDAYPELVEFMAAYPKKGKLLDIGCGQGRDAIPLARLGYSVTGIDHSKVGIEQMNELARKEGLQLSGRVEDMYSFNNFDEFDMILLDSMFHFTSKDWNKEQALIEKIISKLKKGALLIVCIQDTQEKVQILNQSIDREEQMTRLADQKFEYVFEDRESGHQSKTDYRMIVVQK